MTGGLDALYAKLDQRFPPTQAPAYDRLVVASGNSNAPVHRWFKMKEAYSPALLSSVLGDLDLPEDQPLSILDPFSGSGTTATSALLLGRAAETRVLGIEVNPFLALLSRVKFEVLSLSAKCRVALADEVAQHAKAVLGARRGPSPKAPDLAAFRSEQYFPDESLEALMKMRANLFGLATGLSRDLLSVVLASCVEPCSRLRKDGRALRFEAGKDAEAPQRAFQERVDVAIKDLRSVGPTGSAKLIAGSSLAASSWDGVDGLSWDLCLFSPPYPNNIDYSEVYKLEAWFLGLIVDTQGFRALRRSTMRSHPSIRFDDDCAPLKELGSDESGTPASVVDELVAALVSAVPEDRYRRQRERTIRGYIRDSHTVMTHAHSKLRAGGALVYVVGNSRHGSPTDGYTIASDVLLAALAEDVGFGFKNLKVARNLHRRGRHDHLRESVVFLEKS